MCVITSFHFLLLFSSFLFICRAVYFACVLQELYLVLIVVVGFVMYAFYYDCDPVETGRVLTKDQLVPLFIMESLGDWVGLPGLFCASVFSASLRSGTCRSQAMGRGGGQDRIMTLSGLILF